MHMQRAHYPRAQNTHWDLQQMHNEYLISFAVQDTKSQIVL